MVLNRLCSSEQKFTSSDGREFTVHYHTRVYSTKKLSVLAATGTISISLIAISILMATETLPYNKIAMWSIGGAGGLMLSSTLMLGLQMHSKHRFKRKGMRRLVNKLNYIEGYPNNKLKKARVGVFDANEVSYSDQLEDKAYRHKEFWFLIINSKEGENTIHIYKKGVSAYSKKIEELKAADFQDVDKIKLDLKDLTWT